MVLRYISWIDFLAPEVLLGAKGKSGVQTKVGSIMFLAATGIFLWSLVISLNAFFRTDKPDISYETSITADYPKIDISKGFMPPMILPTLNAITAIPFEEV